MAEPDVTTTLEELERKLCELEQQLHGAGRHVSDGAPAAADGAPEPGDGREPAAERPAVDASPTGDTPAPATPPGSAPAAGPMPEGSWRLPAPVEDEGPAVVQPRAAGLSPPPPQAEAVPPPATPSPLPSAPGLQALVAFREQLERATRELLDGYAVAFDAIASARELARPVPALGPLPGRLPASPFEAAKPAGSPWAPAAGDLPDPETMALEGAITVDVGPFGDIAGLADFEQALKAVPGARDVYVRGFQGSYALIDLVLGEPVVLGDELRRTTGAPFTVTRAEAGGVAIALEPQG